ncbi:hypothetical protein Vadar_012847 [Vaccinium darrowii]|uniref:Uncharacterized protein n=1 Tax=Vaccinium darrowii TaxID=229202 RepID=A0ACB7XH98_9ERIC|nr:hypothetical protein Vadar_012847 [Vaccinium darrowii]
MLDQGGKDQSPVDTFTTGLSTSILERKDYEEEMPLLVAIVVLFCTKISQPALVELLQLLYAVSQFASLGFEKSYRAAVVLMTRSYLCKLHSIGSAESKNLPPEATAPKVKVDINASAM